MVVINNRKSSMGHIRGLVFHSRLDYIKHHFDQNARKAIRNHLSPRAEHLFSEQVFPVNLYPISYLKELDTALAAVSQEPSDALFKQIGHKFAAVITDRYFFNYIQQHQTQKFLKQFQILYDRLWGFGGYEVHGEGDNRAHLFFNYPVTIYSYYEIFMQAFLKAALEICGAKKVQIKEEKCDGESEDCRTYFIKWE